jgi:hypothetical protein
MLPIMRCSIYDWIQSDGSRWSRVIRVIEQDKPHPVSARREDAEIGALRGGGCAQRKRGTEWCSRSDWRFVIHCD